MRGSLRRISRLVPASFIPAYKFIQDNKLSSTISMQRKEFSEQNKLNSLSQPVKGKFDAYNGIHVEASQFQDLQEFVSKMQTSIKEWKNNNVKAIWLRIPVEKLQLSSAAIDLGFEMHNCQKDHLILSKWLLEDEPSKLPHYCTHFLGAGGLIVNERNEILLVQEKNGHRKGMWGIPGGLVDDEEMITEAAKREVYEETGLETEPYDMLLFREMLSSRFGKADLYFVILMKLKNPDQQIKLCEKELQDYKWVPIEQLSEFAKQNMVGPTQKELYQTLSDLHARNVLNNTKFFKIQAGQQEFYGSERKFAIFRPHL